MASRQHYPTQDAKQRAHRLTGVSLAPTASTIGRDAGMTLGKASRAKAVATATGPGAPTLVDAYVKWRATQEAQARKAAEDPEARAVRKSRKKLGKNLRNGMAPSAAVVAAHQHYRKNGGRSSLAVWSRKVSLG